MTGRLGGPATGRLGLRRLLGVGARDVSQYTGMLLSLFAVQLVVSWGAGFVIVRLLTSAFADRPLFDEAVDGDLVALAEIVRNSDAIVDAVSWVMIAAVLTWIALGWFIAGGLIAVFTERPRGRRETGRCFGAGGANHFLTFARLGVVSFGLHLPAMVVLLVGVEWADHQIRVALTLGEVAVALGVALVPAALLRLGLSTAVDYARIELVLRRPTHESLGAMHAAGRALSFVFRRPLALVHASLYWLAFVALSLGFAGLAYDHAMLGGSGALALLALRSGVALVRCAMSIGVTAGQVELGATRLPPPRAVVAADPS